LFSQSVPRKPRIEYPRAIYHVKDRGDRRKDIFVDDVDRDDLLKTLAEACQKTSYPRHAIFVLRRSEKAVIPPGRNMRVLFLFLVPVLLLTACASPKPLRFVLPPTGDRAVEVSTKAGLPAAVVMTITGQRGMDFAGGGGLIPGLVGYSLAQSSAHDPLQKLQGFRQANPVDELAMLRAAFCNELSARGYRVVSNGVSAPVLALTVQQFEFSERQPQRFVPFIRVKAKTLSKREGLDWSAKATSVGETGIPLGEQMSVEDYSGVLKATFEDLAHQLIAGPIRPKPSKAY
jgi:hypothetical protein